MSAKHVLLLVGPKGSGKSTIAREIAARPGFVHVEPEVYWLRHALGPRDPSWEREGFRLVAGEVERALASAAIVVTDTTAASEHTAAFVADLGALAPVVVVRVDASEQTCLARIRTREASRHLPADDATIARAHALSIASPIAVHATFVNELDEGPAARARRLDTLLASLRL